MERIFLIDGHAQIFRIYYAFMSHPMINSKGEDTSIIFGFTKMILELIEKERPTHIAVAFDPPVKTFRHEAYPEYKANRSATPELVIEALEPLTEILGALNIPVVMVPGYEADDVIGSMATQWSSPTDKIYMVTPDKDYGQLVSENVYQYRPPKGGGEVEILGKAEICEKYGISDPHQVIDILTIWGDTSDNVPGVKGIGEVGAKKLISKYGSIESVIEHLGELPAKQQGAIRESAEILDMSRFLVTIKNDIKLPLSKDDIKIHPVNEQLVESCFKRYEISSLKKMLNLGGSDLDRAESAQKSYSLKVEQAPLQVVAKKAAENGEVAVKFVGENGLILAASGEEQDKYLYYKASDISKISTSELSLLKELMQNKSIAKSGIGFKEYIKKLWAAGIDLNLTREKGALQGVNDLEIMHYVLDPERSHNIKMLVRIFLGYEAEGHLAQEVKETEEENVDLFSAVMTAESADTQEIQESQIRECALLLPLRSEIEKKLEEASLSKLYREIEMPLIGVLSDMECEGVKIDTAQLKSYSSLLNKELASIESQIRKIAEEPALNISSPKQIGVLLYEKLKLSPKTKKNSKGSYPTDEEKLTELKDKHPVVEMILEYRGLKKLLSTYIDNFPQMIDANHKLHTTFNQALTATGRLSSSNPNLQNIPIRTERGREIRKAFVSSHKGGVIVSADYSQIELRLMAHMSGDSGLIEAFNHGKDIHTATAAKIFKESEESVTKEQRSRAKTANFGIIYGITTHGLSQRLGMSRTDSKALIDEYFTNYPGVKEYIERMIQLAKKQGYVETIYGRRRYLPDINSRNVMVRGFNERNAINAPLQGSAADIIKLAMINVYKRLRAENLQSKMVLQVHDELVLDVVESEKDRVSLLLKEEMENIAKLKVPLIAECNAGENWLEAH